MRSRWKFAGAKLLRRKLLAASAWGIALCSFLAITLDWRIALIVPVAVLRTRRQGRR